MKGHMQNMLYKKEKQRKEVDADNKERHGNWNDIQGKEMYKKNAEQFQELKHTGKCKTRQKY